MLLDVIGSLQGYFGGSRIFGGLLATHFYNEGSFAVRIFNKSAICTFIRMIGIFVFILVSYIRLKLIISSCLTSTSFTLIR